MLNWSSSWQCITNLRGIATIFWREWGKGGGGGRGGRDEWVGEGTKDSGRRDQNYSKGWDWIIQDVDFLMANLQSYSVSLQVITVVTLWKFITGASLGSLCPSGHTYWLLCRIFFVSSHAHLLQYLLVVVQRGSDMPIFGSALLLLLLLFIIIIIIIVYYYYYYYYLSYYYCRVSNS